MTIDLQSKKPFKNLSFNKNAHTIVIHCSASDNSDHDNPETIRRWHQEKGFRDIGYHFYIDKQGKVIPCRPMTMVPAAQLGYNPNTITICLGGLNHFTEAQFTALEIFCYKMQEKYNGFIISKRLKVLGHCEVDVNPKDCPNFDYPRVLNLLHEGYETITARWNEKDAQGNKIKRSKDFLVPLYYLRAKKVKETRTGKGIATCTVGTVTTGAKIAAGAGGLAGTVQAIQTASDNISLTDISSIFNLINSVISAVGGLFSTLLLFVPWWLCFGIIFAGLACVYYARNDDIAKGDVKRFFNL